MGKILKYQMPVIKFVGHYIFTVNVLHYAVMCVTIICSYIDSQSDHDMHVFCTQHNRMYLIPLAVVAVCSLVGWF